MGGLEKVTYDSKEKILYGVSEQGFVSCNIGLDVSIDDKGY